MAETAGGGALERDRWIAEARRHTGDEVAIHAFARRIERLCGQRLIDHMKRDL